MGNRGDQQTLALIVGAMKSGTTSLFELLSQHPQVSPCSEKEPGYFSHDDRWSRGADWYRSLWQDSRGEHAVLLEASSHYTKSHLHPDAPSRIAQAAQAGRDIRVIYIMREPVARMVSHYKHLVSHGFIEASADGLLPDLEALHSVSRYASQIGPYIEGLGRERVLLLSLERMRARPDDTLSAVCRFLGIDASFVFTEPARVHNPAGTPSAAMRFAQRIPGARGAAQLLPQGIRDRIWRTMRRSPRDVDARVTPEHRARLLEMLEPELAALRDEYGFDTSVWSVD